MMLLSSHLVMDPAIIFFLIAIALFPILIWLLTNMSPDGKKHKARNLQNKSKAKENHITGSLHNSGKKSENHITWSLYNKGAVGEYHVAQILSKLPQNEYQVINDLLINQNGQTTQIDHVVVSEYRIFVIETKFYQGKIYGGQNNDYWIQNIYGNKYQLRNPIHQNQKHIHVLASLLRDIDPNLFIPIIAFSRHASVNNIDNQTIVYWDQINEVIQTYQRKWISPEQAQKTYDILMTVNSSSPENRELHVENVKSQIARRKEAIANGRCPRCGGKLVLRNGQYGKFYGCQNYPQCRYTQTT